MSEQIDTGELREQLRSGLWRTWAKVQAIAIGDELDALRAKVAKLTAERDALREELSRLKDAVWPGLPKFVSTPEKPQEDFYIIAAETVDILEFEAAPFVEE